MNFPLALALAAALNAVAEPAPPPTDSLPLRAVGSSEPVVRTSNHALTGAGEAGLSLSGLVHAEAAILGELRRGGFPGAALAMGRGDRIVVEQGVGRTGWGAADAWVDPDRTVYDLASLTKVVATTTAVMLLVEDGKMQLDAPVARYLPEFTSGEKARVTIRHLLTHTSGLPAWAEISAPTPDGALGKAVRTSLVRGVGTQVEYSDIGFVLLYAAAERAAGEPLFRLIDRRVFGPLKMHATTYAAGTGCGVCASTARNRGDAFQGKVHDPIARQLGGVSGNAGLFSTVHDLARFAAMLAGGGELDGVRVLQAGTVREFTRRQPGAGTRALGWDTAARAGVAGERISPSAFGHTGYTGTSIWIDPERGTWAVLLANRTYDSAGGNRMQSLRRAVNDRLADAADTGGRLLLSGR